MASGGDEELRASIGDLLVQIAEDGRDAVRAEVGVWTAVAEWRLSGVKRGLPLLIAALFVAQGLMAVLFVGLVFALAPLIGALWALLVVVLIGLALFGILVWMALKRLHALFDPLPSEKPES